MEFTFKRSAIYDTFHAVLRATPSKILLGYKLRNHPDIELIRYLRKIAKTDLELETDRDASRKLAIKATDSIKNYKTRSITTKNIKHLPNTTKVIML